jgi:hypothetical protein
MNKIDELKRLKSLLDEGAISEHEFQVLKKNIIEELHPNPAIINPTSIAKPDSRLQSSKSIKIILYIGIAVVIALLGYIIISSKQGIVKVIPSIQTDNIDDTAKIRKDNNAVYEGGKEIGKIVNIEKVLTRNKRGSVIKIPEGKMWTPLYYSYEDLGHNYAINVPMILTKKCNNTSVGRTWYYENIYDDISTNTWWYKTSRFYFPKREDFISIKVCKRNGKALTGMNVIMIDGVYFNVRYTLYFLEESI